MKKKYINPTTKMLVIKSHSMLASSPTIGTDDAAGYGYKAGSDGNPVLGKEDQDGGPFGW